MEGMESSFTKHLIRQRGARDLSFIPSESAHLIATSPPYSNLITYPETYGQLGNIPSYEVFPGQLDKVWLSAYGFLCRAAVSRALWERSAFRDVEVADIVYYRLPVTFRSVLVGSALTISTLSAG